MKIILGSMTFGPQVNLDQSMEMLDLFLSSGFNEVDTAYVYNNGDSERILGEIISHSLRNRLSVSTKVHPRVTGLLDRNSIIKQVDESLTRLKIEVIDKLYLHFPTTSTPIEETLNVINELYKAGKFINFGLSNYPSWLVIEIVNLCIKENLVKPSIYQGMYNAITRRVENELLPALIFKGINFYAFNPLAGGLLTGKHTNTQSQEGSGRFSRLKSYRERYWKDDYFEAIEILKKACSDYGIKPSEAALRWIKYHSSIHNSDHNGLIIGASSILQLKVNLEALSKGPLPSEVLLSLDNAWNIVGSECPNYFKFFKK